MSDDAKSIFYVPPEPPEKHVFWKTQAKYFVHGFLWWLVNIVGLFVFSLVLVFLISIGYIIGLIIGFAIMLLFIGFVNSLLSQFLWFPMKDPTFLGALGHGLLLGIALLIVGGLTVVLPVYISGNNIYVILGTFTWGCYIDGYMAKRVAEVWREPVGTESFE